MNTKLSLCMILKPDDEEAKLLDRALSYVAKYVDEICITITGENKCCEDIARKYGAKISHFDWVYDFAKARNYNFAQATGDYIFWLDADDVVRNAEKLPGLVEKMETDHINSVIMHYLYDFNEHGKCIVKHLKTRVVKKGVVEWVGEIHEDFRDVIQLEPMFTDEIEILHITDKKRAESASKRNIEIARKFMEAHPDDPRSEWLMANALQGENKIDEAIKYYEKFLKVSNSDEEKFIANMRLGDFKNDKSYYFEAMSSRPMYPDSYLRLGKYFFDKRKFEQARDFTLQGLKLNVPDRQIVVYNPREYDMYPLMLLADTYFNMGEYKNALEVLKRCLLIDPEDTHIKSFIKVLQAEKEIERAVDEFLKKAEKEKNIKKLKKLCDTFKYQSHPKFCIFKNLHFVKTETSGKDLVYYCAYTDSIWHPESKRIGGSEEAVINLSKQWADMGWNVTVYNNCGHAKKYGKVQYRPFWEFNVRDKQDIIIIWRHPRPVDFNLNAKKIYVDIHDVLPAEEFTEERLKKITKIMVKTKAHRKCFPNVPDDKFVIIPNGLDPEQFENNGFIEVNHKTFKENRVFPIKKNPYLILNTSSPERHIDATLDIFEELIKRDPKNPWRLAWYYGWHNYEKWHKDNKTMMDYMNEQKARFAKLVNAGRAEGGYMISQEEIAKKYLEAQIFLYPTQFYEIHCISSAKAQAAGCYPVTSDFAALNETVQFGTKIHTDAPKWKKQDNFGDTENEEKYLQEIFRHHKEDENKEMMKWAVDTYNWTNIATKWHALLET